jgi:cell division protein FtsL
MEYILYIVLTIIAVIWALALIALPIVVYGIGQNTKQLVTQIRELNRQITEIKNVQVNTYTAITTPSE